METKKFPFTYLLISLMKRDNKENKWKYIRGKYVRGKNISEFCNICKMNQKLSGINNLERGLMFVKMVHIVK